MSDAETLATDDGAGRWDRDRAWTWYRQQPWIVGCNFIPSTASNQLELWQAETFDPQTIDRELGFAESLGFNTVRVYLHDLLWQQDADGFVGRVDRFLDLAAGHGIRAIVVFLDGVWNNRAYLGPQAEPIPGVHNSRWVQSPTSPEVVEPAAWPRLREYVQGVLQRLADDERVLMWDLYNEPGNEGLMGNALPLLREVFGWAREVAPSQPLTVGNWNRGQPFAELNALQAASSDIVTFHSYEDASTVKRLIDQFQEVGRPIICTEYLARTTDSHFETHLPIFREAGVGCISWGLVAGRTQTQFPWYSPPGAPEPTVWYHDIFRADGSPYDAAEVELIRRLTVAQAGDRPGAGARAPADRR
ncbi:MAG: cellulase family glycosylhydrolase [Chloroflexota bacterium]